MEKFPAPVQKCTCTPAQIASELARSTKTPQCTSIISYAVVRCPQSTKGVELFYGKIRPKSSAVKSDRVSSSLSLLATKHTCKHLLQRFVRALSTGVSRAMCDPTISASQRFIATFQKRLLLLLHRSGSLRLALGRRRDGFVKSMLIEAIKREPFSRRCAVYVRCPEQNRLLSQRRESLLSI